MTSLVLFGANMIIMYAVYHNVCIIYIHKCVLLSTGESYTVTSQKKKKKAVHTGKFKIQY